MRSDNSETQLIVIKMKSSECHERSAVRVLRGIWGWGLLGAELVLAGTALEVGRTGWRDFLGGNTHDGQQLGEKHGFNPLKGGPLLCLGLGESR